MFTKEMLAAAAADPSLANHLKAAAAAYAETVFEASVSAQVDAKAEAEAEAEAKAKAEAKAEAEAKAKADVLATYGTEFLTDNLILAAKAKVAAEAVGLRFSSFTEPTINDDGEVVSAFLKCVIRERRKKA
jgi:colicin import membrane protein